MLLLQQVVDYLFMFCPNPLLLCLQRSTCATSDRQAIKHQHLEHSWRHVFFCHCFLNCHSVVVLLLCLGSLSYGMSVYSQASAVGQMASHLILEYFGIQRISWSTRWQQGAVAAKQAQIISSPLPCGHLVGGVLCRCAIFRLCLWLRLPPPPWGSLEFHFI